jgi:hypothetical protein
MLKLVEIIVGVVLIYFGLHKLSKADQVMSLVFGIIAIVGLVLMVHGILLYSVPDFFSSSL